MLDVDSGRSASKILCRNLCHDHPRHLRIKPANAIGANDKIRRIENLALDEIQHGTIDLRPLRLHPVEHEGWRILRGGIALMPVMGSKPSVTSAICAGFG